MKNKSVFLMLLFALVMSIGMISACVADTSAKAYWQQAVAIGIVDTDTKPSEIITRGEFVAMLWKLNGKPEPSIDCPFSDLDSEIAKAATSLFERGVLAGYDSGILGTNDPVTNEMAYVMATHNWNLIPSDPNSYNGYEDADSLSEWARTAASYIFEQGVGSSKTICNPEHAITYGEAVSLLIHLHQAEYFKPGGELDTFIEGLSVEDAFSGTVAVGRGDEILFEGAYGYADRENGVKMLPDTKLNLGSINKSFTAVAIGQLAQAGKLSYSDTIETYLPELAELSKGKMTIEHMLLHTSGLGDFRQSENYRKDMGSLKTMEEMLPYAIPNELLFEPGSGNSYSNSGYLILGVMIERISGEDYFDYIDRHIFAPANMSNSGYYSKFSDTENMAKGYYYDENRTLANNFDTLPLLGSSAGGGYSTARDMLHFMNALNTDVFLHNTYDELRSKDGLGYGMGVQRGKVPRVGASGGAPGISSTYETYPDTGYSIVILTNINDSLTNQLDSFNRVLDEIRWFLFNTPPAPVIKNIQVEINGNIVDTRALLQGDEILLPLLEMCNALDAVITDETIELNGIIINISPEGVTYTANNEARPLPTRVININGKMLVLAPLQFYSETLGYQITIY